MAKKRLRNFERALNNYGKAVRKSAKLRVNATRKIDGRSARRVASGTLRRSLDYEIKRTRRGYGINFYSDAGAYALYIHEGVNGRLRHRGSEFSFRKKNIPREPLKRWLRQKGIRLRDLKTGRFIEMSERNMNSAAFLIGRKITADGIQGVPYYKAAQEKLLPKHSQKMIDALLQDTYKRK